jgi:hypothetical protein
VTAAGVLKTTARGVTQVAANNGPLEAAARTSSSTGGPTWIKPAGRMPVRVPEVAPTRRVQGVVTVMTAGGVLRTVAVDASAGLATGGYNWAGSTGQSEGASWEKGPSGAVRKVTPAAASTLVRASVGVAAPVVIALS